MKKYLPKVLSYLIILILTAWYCLFLAQKIDLTTADLGRHIQNGNIIVNGSWPEKWAVLHTNFYSYTNPEFPFINHHWGSGVVFYFINLFFGFKGLSIFYILLGAATFWLFFDVAKKASNFFIASTVAIVLIPLMASRAEVRPEMFTYFFSGIFFWVLWHWRNQPLPQSLSKSWRGKSIWVLPLIMLIWVNLHVGFFFGIFLIGVFVLDDIINVSKKLGRAFYEHLNFSLIKVLILSCLATLINPNFVRGALYPLNIFKQYGYQIVENQSISFLENIGHIQGMNFTLFKVFATAIAASFILILIFNRKKFNLPFFIIAVVVGIMAYFGIRNFPFFGFFVLPILAFNVSSLIPLNNNLNITKSILFPLAAFLIIVSLFPQYHILKDRGQMFGLGLIPNINASVDFFNNNNISGPVFNNYDVGGYLIYNTRNQRGFTTAAADTNADKMIFVDNRPEAYPVSFFQDIYIPAQQDDAKWQALDEQYNFNAIFFSYRDYTPWGQAFLISRVQDPNWVPVFVDSFNIIFVKRTMQNQEIINKFQLPKSMFGVVTQ